MLHNLWLTLQQPIYLNIFTIIALWVVSAFVGRYLARTWRMPDHGWKFTVILLALLASVVVLWRGWPPSKGVDLGGGVILVYQVDTEKLGRTLDNDLMDLLVTSVSKRVNPGGQKEITVRPMRPDKVEITIPQVDAEEAERIKSIISRAGTLEFRIVATRHDDQALIERAVADPEHAEIKGSDGRVEARWVPVGAKEAKIFAGDRQLATRPGRSGALEVLVKFDDYNVKGDYLREATVGVDQYAKPCVNFRFDSKGGDLFGQLTNANLPQEGFFRRLGIILDGELYSAPTIRTAIYDRGEITGSFTRPEVEDLARVLNAGSLPAALKKEPASQLITGPLLGGDTITKSSHAMILSSILVPLFMIWYYRFAGLVAVLALSLNMVMLIALMILVKAPFTLPALAGLALTVGMAVDNNVLIYERLREELAHGAALRMAIRNAFHRAGVVIIDANVTHLIAATVLFVEGTEQVRGFAVTFWLGAVLSIWATMFVARVMFEVAERQRWITKVKMLHIIGHTQIDFMKWFPACATFSVLITVVGLVVAYARWQWHGLLDIDFTGGVSVQALFNDPHNTIDVRGRTEKENLPDVAVSAVQLGGEAKDVRFLINTSNEKLDEVKRALEHAFGKELVSNSVTVAQVTTVAEPSLPPPGKPAAKPAAKPSIEKPAAEKPVPAKVAPAAAPPPAQPAAKPPEPAAKKPDAKQKTSLEPLPPDTMVAMAGPAPVLLAAADPKAQNTAKEPVSKPAEQPKPAAAPASTPAASPAKPAPVEKPKAEKPAAPAGPVAAATQADLKFQFKIDHDTIEGLVKHVMAAQSISRSVTLDNPEYRGAEDTTLYDHWTLRIQPPLPPQQANAVLAAVRQEVAKMPYFPDVVNIGGAVASDTCYHAVIALVASWVLIILYLWIRFQGVAFGLAAVIALIHDVLVMLAAIAVSYYVAVYTPGLARLLGIETFKINLNIVAAFLTIIGYSVNDTIVVFDRIREVRGKAPRITRQIVNDSTNQTLSRTLLTSFTVLLVVVILYLVAGQALHGLAFALIVGVLTGTYSSIYVAAPVLLWLVHPKEMRRTSTPSLQDAK